MEFNEIQRFRPWWVWVAITIVIIFPLAVLIYHLGDATITYDPPKDILLAVIAFFPFILLILFLSIRFETHIDETGISYQFFPIHLKAIKKNWDSVSEAYVRNSERLAKVQGVRNSARAGTFISLSGDSGLQLVLTDGRRILLGTRKPNEVNKLLTVLKEKGVIKA